MVRPRRKVVESDEDLNNSSSADGSKSDTNTRKKSSPELQSDIKEDDQEAPANEEDTSSEDSIKISMKCKKKKKLNRSITESSDSNKSDSQSTSSDDSSSDSSQTNLTNGRKRKSRNEDKIGNDSKKRKLRSRRFTKTRKKVEESPDKKARNSGRKKIRHMLKRNELTEETKDAEKQEKERRKRVEKMKDEKIVEVDVDESFTLKPVPITKKLVLQKEPLVEVHSQITVHLKPHQVEGVQFIWDNLIETTQCVEKGGGAGCILAHCMGLGKTLQTITVVHTILNSEHLQLKTVLVVAPLNTLINWINEFHRWSPEEECLQLYNLNEYLTPRARLDALKEWSESGGVMVMGYDMFRLLASGARIRYKAWREGFAKLLLDPGPDIIVCDEGHKLKNSESNISMVMNKIKTRRRLVLTGTPLQNNLMEYQCMVNFVKPNLLGSVKEFRNRFVNPIQNGQHSDSTPHDVRLMKKRCHILHNMLHGFVQRKDYTALAQYLCEKYEFIVKVRLTPLQIQLYRHYLDTQTNRGSNQNAVVHGTRETGLFADYQNLMRLWTHPKVLLLHSRRMDNMNNFLDDNTSDEAEESSEEDKDWKTEEEKEEKEEQEERSNSPKTNGITVIHDSDDGIENRRATRSRKSKRLRDSDEEEEESNSSSDEEEEEESGEEEEQPRKRGRHKGRYRLRGGNSDSSDDDGDRTSKVFNDIDDSYKTENNSWYSSVLKEHQVEMDGLHAGGKIAVLFEILHLARKCDDKVLVFSQSLLSLDLIEEMLSFSTMKVVSLEESSLKEEKNDEICQKWYKNIDYFRMDGSSLGKSRQRWIDEFNDETDRRARLFLISTKAGSLGVNLVAANRVVIFDASWNPSHDIQSIFRVYRFGQTKSCFIYRLIAQGSMEEKIYDRQVTKQSLSFRVVDEQQINRHFTAHDLQELYRFTPASLDEVTHTLPKDDLLADLLVASRTKELVVSYHQHDSLLDHQEMEELTEEERKAAWEEYENEKKGRSLPRQTNNSNFQQQHLKQQFLFQQHLKQQQQLSTITIPASVAGLPSEIQNQAQSIFMLMVKATENMQKAALKVHEHQPIEIEQTVTDLKSLPMYQFMKDDSLRMIALELKIRRQQLRLNAEKELRHLQMQLEWLSSRFQNLTKEASSSKPTGDSFKSNNLVSASISNTADMLSMMSAGPLHTGSNTSLLNASSSFARSSFAGMMTQPVTGSSSKSNEGAIVIDSDPETEVKVIDVTDPDRPLSLDKSPDNPSAYIVLDEGAENGGETRNIENGGNKIQNMRKINRAILPKPEPVVKLARLAPKDGKNEKKIEQENVEQPLGGARPVLKKLEKQTKKKKRKESSEESDYEVTSEEDNWEETYSKNAKTRSLRRR